MNKNRTEKLILFASITTLFYFLLLLSISYFKIENVILNVFAQILTIPFLIFLIISLIASIKNWHKTRFTLNSKYFITTIINLLTVILLVLATIFDAKF